MQTSVDERVLARIEGWSGRKIYLDGALVDAAGLHLSALDHGLVVGDGIFETIEVRSARAFALDAHLRRLSRSAELLGLPESDPEVLAEAASRVIEANGVHDGVLRITVTSGLGPLGSGRGDLRLTTLVAAGPLPGRAATERVAVAPWTRNPDGALSGIKSTSYAGNARALAWARARGAGEAVFANTAGQLCEGTGSNVFVVLEGQVLTPPLRSGCLAGVTRSLVLSAGKAREADLPMGVLADAQEVFLTSTTRHVQGVSALDGRSLGAAPGPVTQDAAAAFEDLLSGARP